MAEKEPDELSLVSVARPRSDDPPGELFVDLALPVLDDLYRVACRLEGDRERARDLLQEALLAGYGKFRQLQDRRSFRAWAVRILRHSFLNSRRRRREEALDEPDTSASAGFFASPPLDPEERFLARRRGVELRRALDGLPRRQRLAVVLVDLQEFTYDEAAAALEIPPGTVASRVVRGRAALRARLRRILEEGDPLP